MQNKDLVIRLIQQDMKHHQLISNLESIGLRSDGIYYLELMEIISEIMQVPKDDIEDRWSNTYLHFMNQVSNYPVTSKGEGLMDLAEECYENLKIIDSRY